MNSGLFPIGRSGSMDVPRPRKRRLTAVLSSLAGLLVLAAALAWSVRTFTTAPTGTAVDRATIVTDVVRRGTLTRSVSAAGTFVPQRVRIASATQEGIVEHVFVRPGSTVTVGSPVAQISNPVLVERVTDAESQVAVARANIASARQEREANQLTRRAAIADAQAQAQETAIEERSMSGLIRQGLVPSLSYRKAQIEAEKARNDVAIDRAQLAVSAAGDDAKIAALNAQLAQAQAALEAARAQVAALTVRAGAPGIVQSVALDAGAHVAQGAELARIADQRDLKAVLQVPESALGSVAPGMPARLDTSGGPVMGRVERIAPAAQNGTVAVDVTFDRPLPRAIRPDGTAGGAIELARLPNVLSVARPANAADGAAIDAYKIVDGGVRAVRVRVKLGTGSSDRIQIVSGLAAGDTVIVSDPTPYAGAAELRLR
jgi:HlyD family secretion protein